MATEDEKEFTAGSWTSEQEQLREHQFQLSLQRSKSGHEQFALPPNCEEQQKERRKQRDPPGRRATKAAEGAASI